MDSGWIVLAFALIMLLIIALWPEEDWERERKKRWRLK